MATQVWQMQNATAAAAPWLDWRSADALRNPFTLAILELACFAPKLRESSLAPLCARPTSVVAKLEYSLLETVELRRRAAPRAYVI